MHRAATSSAFLLLLIPLILADASPDINSLSYRGGFIAAELEERGLRWVNLYNEEMRLLWSSSKARFVEFNWSSSGAIAVRLCDGPCYNVNWQRVQVYDPSTGNSWNSSEARFVRFQWSSYGKLAVVLWLSPCPDYSKHWMELYDPSSDQSWMTDYRGFVYAQWSPLGEIAAVVRDEDGYHLEVLDDQLNLRWSSPPAQVVDFKWSTDGKLIVKLEINGTNVLLLRYGDSVEELARGGEIHYAWSDDGNLVYSVGGEIRSLRFSHPPGWMVVLLVGAALIISAMVARFRRSSEGAQENK
ncbi:MAG: hypothetical protein QI197_04655 [Candidatus Korarchaeota archaeon]|nr:hypothetical protein [Candidatus Korarchaeota archaeon]